MISAGYLIITTTDVADSERFYMTAFNARTVFSSPWYAQIAIGDFQLGFVHPNPPVRLPVFRQTTPSRGLTLAFEVADVELCYGQLKQRGIEPLGRPERYPDGEIAFQLLDPSGTVISLIQAARARDVHFQL